MYKGMLGVGLIANIVACFIPPYFDLLWCLNFMTAVICAYWLAFSIGVDD